MPLSANARLGPYEIRSPLGAGGMGEVYQGFDMRLNRNVAIKVLRADHAITPELRARFDREARAIAAFNHPNIVSVYDFGVDADRQYIVSELVEGPSLRSLLTGKPVPIRKLLDIATQVADGLAAAHPAGFVHRDLKPENIMLTNIVGESLGQVDDMFDLFKLYSVPTVGGQVGVPFGCWLLHL